jgi:hypothetical protein
MTSWIRAQAPVRRPAPVVRPGEEDVEAAPAQPSRIYFYHTSDEDVLAQFNELFYSYLYARSQGAPLHVYDQSNPVVPNLEVVRTTFKDISGLIFTDGRLPNTTTLNKRGQLMQPLLRGLKLQVLRTEAEAFFQVRDSLQAEIVSLLTTQTPLAAKKSGPVPRSRLVTYDVGLALPPTARLSSQTLAPSLAALRNYQFTSKKSDLQIFVAAADPAAALEELKKSADPSWTFYALPPVRAATGAGSAAVIRAKRDAYIHLLAEISQLQNLPVLFVPMGQPVGRFLALTAADGTEIRSIDGEAFAPV